MEKSLVPFAFEDALVRVLQDKNGNPLFVAKDVCRALGYADASNTARLIAHVPEEWKGVNPIHTLGGEQDVLTLTEQGLYFFLARSDKPKALPFQKWLAGEVLPAIRKTGVYVSPARANKFNIPLIPESLGLRRSMRQRLWSDALQTARLDNGNAEDAVHWFAELCRMITAQPPMLTESDEISRFLDECCVLEPPPPPGCRWQSRAPVGKFVAILNRWLAETRGNTYLYSAHRVTKALAEKGIHTMKSNTMYYLGIRIRREVWQGYGEQMAESGWRMAE